ncbi:MAG: nicotinate (nicotinamide) nucleotide adenylyltransferase [Candidatus Cryosericum sp.]
MRTVLFGGAFDPVHVGHVFIGCEALRLLTPCQLVLIPTGSPNPAFDKHLSASDDDRVAMLQLAFGSMPEVIINDLELRRKPRLSYFIDTLEALLPSLGPAKPVLLIGEDQLVSFPRWHRYEDILAQVELRFVPRADRRHSENPQIQAVPLFDVNPFDSLSSTFVRERLQTGLPVDGLVPDVVAGYITDHNLYRNA